MVAWAEEQGVVLDPQSPKVLLDAEDMWAGEAATIIAKLERAVELCQAAGILPGVYTRSSYWRGKVENTTAFSHLPLADAWYGHQDPEDFIPYGGWESCAVRQWHDTTSLAGVGVDLDSRWVVTRR